MNLQNETPPLPANPTDTQIARAQGLYPTTGTLKRRYLALIQGAGEEGLTDDEAGESLGCAWSTAGSYRHMLNRSGQRFQGFDWVARTARRRPTRSNRPAIVWVLTDEARRYLETLP